jgi:hypothetical protein
MQTIILEKLKGLRIVSSHARRQSLENGVLLDITLSARKVGFMYPVAVTRSLWEGYIKPSPQDQQADTQSVSGRLWDLLWSLKCAISGRIGHIDGSTVIFPVQFVINGEVEEVSLKAIGGVGSDMKPVLTVTRA